jgi:hypothetical protein
MLSKQKVIKTVNALPNSFSIEEVIDKLVLLQKIENGLAQSKNNQIMSTSAAKLKLKKLAN